MADIDEKKLREKRIEKALGQVGKAELSAWAGLKLAVEDAAEIFAADLAPHVFGSGDPPRAPTAEMVLGVYDRVPYELENHDERRGAVAALRLAREMAIALFGGLTSPAELFELFDAVLRDDDE